MYVDQNATEGRSDPSGTTDAGMAGSGLDGIVEAAGTGQVRVAQLTGTATMQALAAVQEQVDTLRRLASGESETRLGGGYAERIDRFNRDWTVAGDGSATEVMDRFSEQLGRLREAVALSMVAYQDSDSDAEHHVGIAGESL
ncbi:hypothetical protein BLA60_19755 [Actinophytocola xinjiangensis]|uniref:Uncharacterized protein n=1 Tax=Actinophytocola xinjiangensis TaxID=485602 RepID=A0A7Z1AY95_9PSEU|nr:hypothetical protein [Actinophytocola xinjiangensis]OLF09407.1 hypothetical protein BLA60_19755 [Actinophytocola xinjiangensis]